MGGSKNTLRWILCGIPTHMHASQPKSNCAHLNAHCKTHETIEIPLTHLHMRVSLFVRSFVLASILIKPYLAGTILTKPNAPHFLRYATSFAHHSPTSLHYPQNLPMTFRCMKWLMCGVVDTWHSYTPESRCCGYLICSIQSSECAWCMARKRWSDVYVYRPTVSRWMSRWRTQDTCSTCCERPKKKKVQKNIRICN